MITPSSQQARHVTLLARLLPQQNDTHRAYLSSKVYSSTTSIPIRANRENGIIKYLLDYHTIYPMSKILKHPRCGYFPIRRTHVYPSDKNALLYMGYHEHKPTGKTVQRMYIHKIYRSVIIPSVQRENTETLTGRLLFYWNDTNCMYLSNKRYSSTCVSPAYTSRENRIINAEKVYTTYNCNMNLFNLDNCRETIITN